jgi:hypothetical protein
MVAWKVVKGVESVEMIYRKRCNRLWRREPQISAMRRRPFSSSFSPRQDSTHPHFEQK